MFSACCSYIRVQEGGAIDAAKPVKEGLSEACVASVLAACGPDGAQPGDLLLLAAGPRWENPLGLNYHGRDC